MTYSTRQYIATGSPQVLDVPTPYLDPSHIKVYVAGILSNAWSWVTDSTISITALHGLSIYIKRSTSPDERLTDYMSGVTLTEGALDVDSLQAFYLAQESIDNAGDATVSLVAVEGSAASAAASAASSAESALNAQLAASSFPGYRHSKVFTATGGQTLFTLDFPYTPGTGALNVFVNGVEQHPSAYTETSTSSLTFSEGLTAGDNVYVRTGVDVAQGALAANIAFQQSGAGAVATDVNAKLQETVSALDFMTASQRADVVSNTGSLDVTAALQAWATCGKKFGVMPEGTYRISDEITPSLNFNIRGAGIGKTLINQVTSNKGGFKYTGGSLAYLNIGGFTLTGAGTGSSSSVGVLLGDAAHGTYFCRVESVEITKFGDANLRMVNGYRCKIHDVYLHGLDTPASSSDAANYGLHMLGTFAFWGSNFNNEISKFEAYNNKTDILSELGAKNVFTAPYVYNQNFTGTVHHIHEKDSSLNSWFRPHVEPLSLSGGGTAMWLIESTSGNPYTYMLGPIVKEMEYENGTLGTTVNVMQIGTSGGSSVYNTTVESGRWQPVSGGKYHIDMQNEQCTRIAHNCARNNNNAFDRLVRELNINNPNASSNNSYVGSPFETSYGTWTPVLYAETSAASLATLTGNYTWSRNGNMVSVRLDGTLSAKTVATGTISLRGLDAISPNGGTTIFTPKSVGAIPVLATIFNGSGVRQTYNAYFNSSSARVYFVNDSTGAFATEASFANGYQVILSFNYPIA